MSELLVVQQYLASKGLGFVVPRVVSPTSGVLVIEVPRDRVGATSASGRTSRRQLAFLGKSLEKKFGRRVLVTLREAQSLDDVAASLRAILKREFEGAVEDVHVSFVEAKAAVVWVETPTIPDANLVGAMHQETKKVLIEFGIECQAFDLVAPLLPEPSTIAILRSVKVLAPASLPAVIHELGRRGFSCPSEKWLSYKLDVARKRGLVQRDHAGRFVMTADGLGVVPTSRSSSSSDVERMLMLARRREW